MTIWDLGHKIREIDRTQHSVTIEETATTAAAVGFGLFALFFVILIAVFHIEHPWLHYLAAAGFASAALYGSVRSNFIADKILRRLVIERRLFFLKWDRSYDSLNIDHAYVIASPKGGSGIGVRFRSGRKKSLTMTLGYQYLACESAVVALNSFLNVPGEVRRHNQT